MKSILLTIMLFIFPSSAMGQGNDSKSDFEIQRLGRKNLETTAALSAASGVLHERLSSAVTYKEQQRIVNDAVLIGDRSIIAYLKARKEMKLSPMQEIDLGLVALGETQYVGLAIEELKSENYTIQYYAIWKLARFKTKEAYRKLYELLDDVKPRGEYKADGALYRTLSDVTKDELFETAEAPPKVQHDTEAWKDWFKKNNWID